MKLILAIDDDKNMLKLLEKQIESMGHKLIIATSGKEGIDLATSGNPDIILLDIMMPGMDGFQVVKSLKKEEITKNTPVIMLTSKSGKESVIEAMRIGVVDYIVKPYNFFNLSKKIGSALRYSLAVKTKNEISRAQYIDIMREKGITTISFKSALNNHALIDEARKLFNPAFINQTKNDAKVLDLRSLPEFRDSDIQFLETLISLLGNTNLHIVAGKYYGDLVAVADLEQKINLFISYGDFEVLINRD